MAQVTDYKCNIILQRVVEEFIGVKDLNRQRVVDDLKDVNLHQVDEDL